MPSRVWLGGHWAHFTQCRQRGAAGCQQTIRYWLHHQGPTHSASRVISKHKWMEKMMTKESLLFGTAGGDLVYSSHLSLLSDLAAGLDCARREISSSFQEPSSLVLSPKAVMETTPTRAFQKGRCTRRRLTQRYRQRLAGLSWNVYVTERNHFPRFPGNFPPGKKKEKPISIDQLGCDSRLVDTFWK